MRSILIALVLLTTGYAVQAQQQEEKKSTKKDWSKIDLSHRSADHFLMQFGYSGWANKPDSIKTSGFNRSFNMYLLFDFPFKTQPKLSVAIGLGVGTDNIYFDKTTITIKNRQEVVFKKDTLDKYKKYKMATGYLEIPVELRYSTNPANMNKGFKIAIGAKVGTNMDAKTKAKVDLDVDNYGGYIYKEKAKYLFNSTRLVTTARIGYGNISVFGTYAVTGLFKDGRGPQVMPWTIGLCLSGL